MSERDPATAGSWPKFRPDAEILTLPLARGGGFSHLVRDRGTGCLFEIGERGAFICRALDGRTPPEGIAALYQEQFDTPLQPREIQAFVEQLKRHGLIEGVAPFRERRSFAEILDPEVFLPLTTIHLMKGDRLIGFLTRALRWVFSPFFHAAACGIILAALWIFLSDPMGYLGTAWRDGGLLFILVSLGSTCLIGQSGRSLVHGLLCKRYGRQVSEINLALIYHVLPVVFCDWTDIMWLPDRRKRLWTVFSGLYYQILLWSVATLAWWICNPEGTAALVWLAVSVASGLGLILVNGNPLVQMDGHLLLAGWLRFDSLRQRGLAAFGAWASGWPMPEPLPARTRRWLILYGGATFVYGLAHVGTALALLWIGLTPRIGGAGALITIAFGLYLIQKPLGALLLRVPPIRWLVRGAGAAVWAVRFAVAGAVVAALLLPCGYETGGAFQLIPVRRAIVRSEVEGRIERVLVREGEWVSEGQPVALLAPRKHERNQQAAQGELDGIRAEIRLLHAGPKPEKVACAVEELLSARSRLAWSDLTASRSTGLFHEGVIPEQTFEDVMRQRNLQASRLREAQARLDVARSGARQEELESLEAKAGSRVAAVENYAADVERTVLRSPIDGRIDTPRVEEAEGRYILPGLADVVLHVQDSRVLVAEIDVPEEDLPHVRSGARARLAAWARPGETLVGSVAGIAPVASSDGAHPQAMSAQVDDLFLTRSEDSRQIVRVTVPLDNAAGRLLPGMTGYAKIEAGRRPFWSILIAPVARWLRVEFWYWT